MKQTTSDFLWREGARLIMIAVFILSVLSKLISPEVFFTMTASFGLALNMAEIIYSILISVELALVVLLLVKPMPGILWSAILLILYSMIIIILNTFDFGTVYGCFGDVSSSEIGFTKILQHIGLAFLLFSSWWIRKGD